MILVLRGMLRKCLQHQIFELGQDLKIKKAQEKWRKMALRWWARHKRSGSWKFTINPGSGVTGPLLTHRRIIVGDPVKIMHKQVLGQIMAL